MTLKVRISNDNQRCVSTEHFMIKPEVLPPPLGKDILVLTKFGKTVIGKWGPDCLQWFPIPDKS